MTTDTETLLVDGRRLEIRRVGSRSAGAPTLVFLHEGLGSVALWKDFPDRLARAASLPALVYSRLGYGGSDPAPLPRPVTFLEDEAIAVLPKVLDATGVRDAVLVGHSDGASIALIHAASVPPPPRGPVRAVIVEAPHVLVEEVTLASIRRAGEAYRAGGPVQTLMLPAPCGHSPHVERGDQVLAAMTRFLRGLGLDAR